MEHPTQEEINKAIKSCKWRQPFHGTDICSGNCNICSREIQAGRCDALQRLFAAYAQTSSEETTKRKDQLGDDVL